MMVRETASGNPTIPSEISDRSVIVMLREKGFVCLLMDSVRLELGEPREATSVEVMLFHSYLLKRAERYPITLAALQEEYTL